MKTKWASFAKVVIAFLMLVLFVNAMVFCVHVRQDMNYGNRCYGLAELDDSFNRGDYQRVYIETLHNKYASTKPQVDTSQYEAFGRYYHAYVQSRLHEDNAAYLQQMEEEKAHITWKKILNVIDLLEQRE